MQLSKLRFSWGLLVTSLAFVVGCGTPDYYTTSGTVTKDGEAIPHVQITFSPDMIDSVRPPMTIADENGKFEMKTGREYGVPPGGYTVHIQDPAAADGLQTSTEENYLYVIDRYSPQKSDLKYTADAHRSDLELKLDTKEYTGPKVRDEKVQNTTDGA